MGAEDSIDGGVREGVAEDDVSDLLEVDPAADDYDENANPEEQEGDRQLEVHVTRHKQFWAKKSGFKTQDGF